MRRTRVPSGPAALAAGLALLFLPACGSTGGGGSTSLFTVTRMRSPAGQAEVLLAPRGPAKGLVLFEHGYGETERVLLRTKGLFPLRDTLLRHGFALATSYSHGDNMGSPVSVQDQVVLLRDAEAQLPDVSGKPVDVVGFSMGGLDALMVASRHAVPRLDAVVVLSGMCNQLPFLSTSLGPPIRRAYGNRTGQALVDAIAAGNPERQDPHSFLGYRYWFWQSPRDTTVPPTQAAGMVALLRSAGAPVQLSPLSGNHGDLTKLQPDRIAQFFEG